MSQEEPAHIKKAFGYWEVPKVSSDHEAQGAYMKEKYEKAFGDWEVLTKESGEVPTDSDNAMVFPCEICGKNCVGYISFQLHLMSKTHSKKIKQKIITEQLRKNPEANLEVEKSVLEGQVEKSVLEGPQLFANCKTCNKKFYGPTSYRDHLSCGNHKKKIEQSNFIQMMTDVHDEAEMDCKPFTSCQICNKQFTGPIPYQIHINSEIHKKNFKRMELLKLQPDRSLYCTDCDKHFSGPEIYEQHMKSNSHSKRLVKISLTDTLEKKFPEMNINPIHQDEYAKNSVILACNICNTSFSGPESAQAHFVSKKHAKAMQYYKLANKRKMDDASNEIHAEPSAKE